MNWAGYSIPLDTVYAFYTRLRENLLHLTVLGVNYRVPDEFASDVSE